MTRCVWFLILIPLTLLLSDRLPAARADEADPPPIVQYAQARKVFIAVCESFDSRNRAILRVEQWLRGAGHPGIVLARPFLEERSPYINQRNVLDVGGRYLLCTDEADQPYYRGSAIPLPHVGALREPEWPALVGDPAEVAALVKEIIEDAGRWPSKPTEGVQMRFGEPTTLTAGEPVAITLEFRNLTCKVVSLSDASLEMLGFHPPSKTYVALSPHQVRPQDPVRISLAETKPTLGPGAVVGLRLGAGGPGADLEPPRAGPIQLWCTLRMGRAKHSISRELPVARRSGKGARTGGPRRTNKNDGR